VTDPIAPAAIWKRVVAAVLDFFTVFFVAGWVIAQVAGGTTDTGFKLEGGPAIALFVLIAAYFFIGRRYAGGTLWDRIFRIGRPQPR
jgi:intracellular septation protein A